MPPRIGYGAMQLAGPGVYRVTGNRLLDGDLDFIAAGILAQSVLFVAIFYFVYSAVRFVEAYGLWRMRAWAEWFAIISGCVYLPIEVYELFDHATLIRAGILILNAAIVSYLLYVRLSRTGHLVEDAIHRTEAENKARKMERKIARQGR